MTIDRFIANFLENVTELRAEDPPLPNTTVRPLV